MPLITFLPSNTSVEAAEGTSLLDAIKAAGLKFTNKCGGNGKCGTCHIFVPEGRKSLSKIQRVENELLDTIIGVGSKSRLACQSLIGVEPVTVEILSFI